MSCWGLTTTDVAVTNDPLLSVKVLEIVISGGVIVTFDPYESVIVETTTFDRVNVGCVVMVFIPSDTD